jgi:hypothetical protein
LGYYDLRVPDTREAQSALARDYGIEGFCYWHYWFEGRRILDRPFCEVLASGRPDFPFCLGWANQSWTGIWHGAPDRVLIHQTYGGERDARRHFEAVLPAFLDHRYLRVDDCPVFVLHQPQELPEPRVFTGLWREWARAEGLSGIFFLGTQEVGSPPPHEYGLDGTLPSPVGRLFHSRTRTLPDRVSHRFGWPLRIPYREVLRHALPQPLVDDEYPCVLSNWDNTPRAGSNGLVLTGASPRLFSQHLDQAIAAVEPRPVERRLVFLKSWNEWAEGNFVEPDSSNGRAYLEAIRRSQCATPG